ncbi:MAG: hypothetical protein R3D60_09150 [Paracoccaceae bacterium]
MGDDDDDLWFLPGPVEDDDLSPLPRADSRLLFDPDEWRRAEAAQAGELAHLALLFGELDARLRMADPRQRAGLNHRLALNEAADIAWWAGDRFAVERLGLWLALRIGSTAETEDTIARAGWAVRRLTEGPPPAQGLAAFLERPADSAVADLADTLAAFAGLNPVTQSAMLFHAWRMIGPEQARDVEAAVLAARHGATLSRSPGQGAQFLPLVTTGPGALRGQGEPLRKLSAWIEGAAQACLAALLALERLRVWRQRADAATADLSGRVPALLLDVLETWPLVPAPLAEAETGASRAAVQRNLDRLAERGLVREVTGQGRFRVWTAEAP